MSAQGSDGSSHWTTVASTSRARPTKTGGKGKSHFADQLAIPLRSRVAGRGQDEKRGFSAARSVEYQARLELPDLEVLSNKALLKNMATICSVHKVNVRRDIAAKEIIIEAANPEDVQRSVAAVRSLLDETTKELTQSSEHYLVQPPGENEMMTEVIARASIAGPQQRYAPVLSGRRLDGVARLDWIETRRKQMVINATKFAEYLRQGLAENDHLQGKIKTRVEFGQLLLTRVDKKSLCPGFSYAKCIEMMSNPKITSIFNNQIGGMQLAKTLLGRIQSDKRFRALDSAPLQTIVYSSTVGGVELRLEAELVLSSRGNYTLGNTELHEIRESDETLSVRVLDFESTDWKFEIVTNRTVFPHPPALLSKVTNVLSAIEPKGDALGGTFPVWKHEKTAADTRQVYTDTCFKYGLVDRPYYLEVCISRGLSRDTSASCTATLRSVNWDDAAEFMFGAVQVSSIFPVRGAKGDGVGPFLDLMEKVARFISEALPVLD